MGIHWSGEIQVDNEHTIESVIRDHVDLVERLKTARAHMKSSMIDCSLQDVEAISQAIEMLTLPDDIVNLIREK